MYRKIFSNIITTTIVILQVVLVLCEHMLELKTLC